MGLIKDSFGWLLGISKQSMDMINVSELESKLRDTKRLQMQWERDIQSVAKEYNEFISPEKMLQKSPLERTFSIQRAKIAAKRMNTLTGAVTMLYKMAGVVEQIKDMKKFYEDVRATTLLPKGMTMEQFVKEAYKLVDVLKDKRSEMENLGDALAELSTSMDNVTGSDETKELEVLFERYSTLVAEGKQEEALKVKAEIDKKAGVAVIAS